MQSITLKDRLKIPEDVVFQKIGEETVLLNLKTGYYYGLDPLGTLILESLAKQGSLQVVYESVLQEYEVTPDELQRDILRLVRELQAESLLEIVR